MRILHNKMTRLGNGSHLLSEEEERKAWETIKSISARQYQLRKYLNLLLL